LGGDPFKYNLVWTSKKKRWGTENGLAWKRRKKGGQKRGWAKNGSPTEDIILSKKPTTGRKIEVEGSPRGGGRKKKKHPLKGGEVKVFKARGIKALLRIFNKA